MKTLFINIYRDITISTPNTEVFNAGKDNILDGFYISLGMAIAEGVSVGEYKPLVADFAVAKPTEFNLFKRQWEELKQVLLGDSPKGKYDFQLSSEYLEWLKINASTVYYKKYQGQHQASIRLDIEELYEDTVDAIRRKVLRFLHENDNYKNFDEFVVNDKLVNRRSKIVRSIKEQFEDNIAFVSYEKWQEDTKEEVCPDCEKNPCECERAKVNFHKAGKNQSSKDIKWSDLFPALNITLGETNIQTIARPGRIEKTLAGYYYNINQYSPTFVRQRYEDDFITIMRIHSYRPKMFPEHWKKLLGISFESSKATCLKELRRRRFIIVKTSDESIWNAITPDKRYIFQLDFFLDRLNEIEVLNYQCPYCSSKKIEMTEDGYDELSLYCNNCGHQWGYTDSNEDYDDDLDGLNTSEDPYEFDEDEYDYNNVHHTYYDKPGKIVQDIYEGLLGLTGYDYRLGDKLIDLGIDDDILNEILIKCKQKLSVTIINELDVYKNDISDLIRLVQKYYYIKKKR